MIKRYDRGVSMGTGDRFRFEMLQSRFQSLVELWDRGIRSREEGRAGPVRAAAAEGRAESGQAGWRQSRQRDGLHRSGAARWTSCTRSTIR